MYTYQYLHLLDVLHQWCQAFGMTVNLDKSKVVHFRRGPSLQHAVGPFIMFMYEERPLEVVDRYCYLRAPRCRVHEYEFMDMSVTAKHIAQGSVPFDC